MTLAMNTPTMKRSLPTLRSSRFSLSSMLALLLMLLAAVSGFAQQKTSNWLFGQNAWIQFPASGSPTSLTGSALFTGEGSSSISDSSGNLLFYTDGVTVWDKNHHIMTNGTGLNGTASSTNSALILQCSCNKYFIFTTDSAENGYAKGLQYSVVDLSTGTGVVAASTKNTVLLQPAAEKIAAISDGFGGFWVVGHGMNDNRFYSWHILPDNNCILARPVISAVGTVYSGGTVSFGQGQIKASPDRSKLAVAGHEINGSSFVELFSFNAATGVVGNLATTTIRDNTPTDMFYGVEFSPSGQYLYASATWRPNKLYQYSATATSNPAFTSSKRLVNDFHVQNAYEVGALQLGPDGKIYIARALRPFLSAITAPDNSSPNVGFVDQAVQLAHGTASWLGLPAMFAGTFPCAAPTPVDPCCPPWNSAMLKNLMSYQGSGGIGGPYTLQFQPTATFNAQMLAYLNYLHTLDPVITSITISFTLVDGGTGSVFVPGPTIEGPHQATWTYSGGLPTLGFFTTQMSVNHWYRVSTFISLNGKHQFFSEKCANNWINVNLLAQGNSRILKILSPDGNLSERRINSEKEIQ